MIICCSSSIATAYLHPHETKNQNMKLSYVKVLDFVSAMPSRKCQKLEVRWRSSSCRCAWQQQCSTLQQQCINTAMSICVRGPCINSRNGNCSSFPISASVMMVCSEINGRKANPTSSPLFNRLRKNLILSIKLLSV